jgi:hypothetical protein
MDTNLPEGKPGLKAGFASITRWFERNPAQHTHLRLSGFVFIRVHSWFLLQKSAEGTGTAENVRQA